MTLLINKPQGLAPDLTLTDDTIEGCGFLGGTISSANGQRRNLSADCGTWASKWRSNVARDHPQIAVVQIGGWDEFDDKVNGVELSFGSPAWDTYYNTQLAKATQILLAGGAQVALLSVPCYQPINAGGPARLPRTRRQLAHRAHQHLAPSRGCDRSATHLHDRLAAPVLRRSQGRWKYVLPLGRHALLPCGGGVGVPGDHTRAVGDSPVSPAADALNLPRTTWPSQALRPLGSWSLQQRR